MNKPILECNGIAAGYVKGLNILQGIELVVSEGNHTKKTPGKVLRRS